MSWRNPRTTNEAPFIKSSKFEREVRDNLKYLKDTVETLDAAITGIDLSGCVMRDGSTVAYAAPTGLRQKDQPYQNTSGKIRVVSITATVNSAGKLTVYCGSANPPTVAVGAYKNDVSDGTSCGTITFLVPPSYYYKAAQTASALDINTWVEWDLL